MENHGWSDIYSVGYYNSNLTHSQYLEAENTDDLKGYLLYKTITSQNVSPGAQVKNFYYFVEKFCSVLKIFKFLYV